MTNNIFSDDADKLESDDDIARDQSLIAAIDITPSRDDVRTAMSHTFSENKAFSNSIENQLCQQAKQQMQPPDQIDRIEVELNILDDDYMMSSPFRICKECGNDHSFKGNFENAKTSVDIISKILSKKRYDYGNLNAHQAVD